MRIYTRVRELRICLASNVNISCKPMCKKVGIKTCHPHILHFSVINKSHCIFFLVPSARARVCVFVRFNSVKNYTMQWTWYLISQSLNSWNRFWKSVLINSTWLLNLKSDSRKWNGFHVPKWAAHSSVSQSQEFIQKLLNWFYKSSYSLLTTKRSKPSKIK